MKKSAAGQAVGALLTLSVFVSSLPSQSQGQSSVDNIRLLTTETDYGKRHDVVGSWRNELVSSPDRKRLAYWAYKPGKASKMYVVVNGVPGKAYDYPSVPNPRAGTDPPPGEILFSPDSRHLAYRALRGNNWMVVQGGRESKLYKEAPNDLYENTGRDVIDDIVWSPNSRHLAFRAQRGKKWHVVLDGKEGKSFDWIADNDLHFSADSERLAYHARRGRRDIMVLHEGARVREIGFKPKPAQAKPTSKDSTDDTKTDQASIVQHADKLSVLWNGREGKPYDEIAYVTTGPDDRYLAYWAKRNERWFIVVDEVEGKSYRDGAGPDTSYTFDQDSPRPTHNLSPLLFESPQSLHTIALRADGHIVRVEVKIMNH